MPHRTLQDGPLARVDAYDLTGPAGMALLRRFDAQFHRMPPATRAEALPGLRLVLPLAERAEGLLVLPGGALAWRDGGGVLVCDPGSAIGVAEAAALWQAAEAAGGLCIRHGRQGLGIAGGPRPPCQAATLLPQAAGLAALLPAVAEWRGPAMIHWQDGGAAVWEMVPAPPALALAASLAGEALEPGAVLPRFHWAMSADEGYQHLSSGLAAHLDEVLGSEVSDALRFALVAQWTDGEDSMASRLADGLALLPSAFAAEPAQPAGMAPLGGWPRAAARLRPGQALLGIAAAEAANAWDATLRQRFLMLARELLPEGAQLATEAPCSGPAPLHGLAADRLVRQDCPACAVLVPPGPGEAPQDLLRHAAALAPALGVPLLLAVPGWGLCHLLDPAGGRGSGNGTAYGLGAALELFEEG
jgi:hypothetical protein